MSDRTIPPELHLGVRLDSSITRNHEHGTATVYLAVPEGKSILQNRAVSTHHTQPTARSTGGGGYLCAEVGCSVAALAAHEQQLAGQSALEATGAILAGAHALEHGARLHADQHAQLAVAAHRAACIAPPVIMITTASLTDKEIMNFWA